MTDDRNDYGFPFDISTHRNNMQNNAFNMLGILSSYHGARLIGYGARQPTKLERAQAYAAEVRTRRNMVVVKGYYVDLKP